MNEDFNKYLAIANNDIQMANDYGQLKSYVASLLYDNDKKVELLQQKDKEIERLNNIINEFEKLLKEERTRTKYAHDVERFTAYDYMLKRLQELKGSDEA